MFSLSKRYIQNKKDIRTPNVCIIGVISIISRDHIISITESDSSIFFFNQSINYINVKGVFSISACGARYLISRFKPNTDTTQSLSDQR